jgi:excisionase family DNA binding protein
MREPRSNSSELPHLVDIDSIAEHLGVEVRHVRRLVAERRIPYVKWGHLLRFDPVDIATWLDDNTRKPSDDRTCASSSVVITPSGARRIRPR